MEKKREIPAEVKSLLETRRFILSPEKFSKERLNAFRGVFETLKEKYPEVLSAHVYGSMTKGYATPLSDIDITLFVEDRNQNDERWLGIEADFNWLTDSRLNVPFSNIGVFPISREILDKLINKAAQDKSSVSEMSEFEWLSLARPFTGISVGSIIDYRKYILEKLKELPNGELIWKKIIDFVRIFERNLIDLEKEQDLIDDYYESEKKPSITDRGEYKSLYPQTIQEAFHYYVERKSFRDQSQE
ncbi:MAG: hypothetical protein A3I44_05920 [Candidatus Sungbacteria bacterium RIFCSPLOWO2_02_FULL_51_17]|uniref:Polymerase beta nucleotidyltransferase domain-containing protein n=1 Tax=Candidatus Sungbacteria bacterium RIFCSPHIGHO2_02_FULL_51_29 TaxID=1802273 RepID=A0A1G2KRD8_9BACT|nr:MAG: hypothetical protein A2676_01445 [Candidatus Sungbacteria bacterium RIFCSPHIGHO2_01_FULL_51_22]OHA01844.1 MAG: hypothetical protein A3C16_06030 [Candidatus Sungbacteria bacterium RIFCSPHIGHO2_02_FULL_51_29]OHA04738.1 MAG: hypothetical protein A3B29_02630 [Candidatus Sungbacteria bacterium RIFCSPLOWO2_01_FULL_51_34]OHA12386.1 MAG: hypothetical protein A3I44_05920 [Candidatus Sungbacteria bacterium RIFCSPLOWO2_02_FULL_51_17]